ncbi:stage III sporulation protein AF [Paenibacillus sp. sgz302251]|uniref:stage III sporulation protein AF n=1 Tax=Paenibacillus sp. sgz302251 TaxID=3414493 RepID=UPI003C7A4B1F
MVAWLSDWLRDIIAVILLAVFVELLLPNKAMQRYARLVVGLFILLTILSPILKLIQSDISTKLDEEMDLWSESAMARQVPMTGLSQIQRDAEQLSEQRALEASKLAERTMESTMKAELIERTQAPVESVDAVMEWINVSGQQMPLISEVIVTLKSVDEKAGSWKEASPVEEVQPVAIGVQVEKPGEEEGARNSTPKQPDSEIGFIEKAEADDGLWSEADPAAAAAIKSTIEQRWGVAAKQIVVRQPAPQQGASH